MTYGIEENGGRSQGSNVIGCRLLNLLHPPQTLADLSYEVEIAWNEILQQDFIHLIRIRIRQRELSTNCRTCCPMNLTV